MISMRQHAISIAAIFLALAIGVVLALCLLAGLYLLLRRRRADDFAPDLADVKTVAGKVRDERGGPGHAVG